MTPRVALTFDDGPSQWTEPILDLLRDAGAHATFFILGANVLGRRRELKRMSSDGHEIGLHGWDHTPVEELTPEALRGQIMISQAGIRHVVGTEAKYWRSPWGRTDDGAADVIVRTGLRIVGSGFNAFDCDRDKNAIVKTVVPQLADEMIVCLHDGVAPNAKDPTRSRQPTVDALPAILKACKSVTVSELLA